MKDFNMIIGQNLKSRREAAGVSRQEAANYMEYASVQSIFYIESGERGASAEAIWLLCHLYGCRPSQIFPKMVGAEIMASETLEK